MEELLNNMFIYGDILILGNKGTGKTNALMCLAEQIRQDSKTKLVIIETFPKWINEFNKIPCLIIYNEDVVNVKKRRYYSKYYYVPESQIYNKYDLFKRVIVNDTSEVWIQRGTEIENFIEQNKNVLFTLYIENLEKNVQFTYAVISYYYKKAIEKKLQGLEPDNVVFVIDETQNLFDYSLLGRKNLNSLRKIYNEARNLNIHFIMCTQRLQDISTKIRGRTLLLIGKVNMDDWKLKVEKICKNSTHKNEILHLQVGQFLDLEQDRIIQFDKFNQKNKPYIWQTNRIILLPKEEKREGLLTKIWKWLK